MFKVFVSSVVALGAGVIVGRFLLPRGSKNDKNETPSSGAFREGNVTKEPINDASNPIVSGLSSLVEKVGEISESW